jgi:hypothetical protein
MIMVWSHHRDVDPSFQVGLAIIYYSGFSQAFLALFCVFATFKERDGINWVRSSEQVFEFMTVYVGFHNSYVVSHCGWFNNNKIHLFYRWLVPSD